MLLCCGTSNSHCRHSHSHRTHMRTHTSSFTLNCFSLPLSHPLLHFSALIRSQISMFLLTLWPHQPIVYIVLFNACIKQRGFMFSCCFITISAFKWYYSKVKLESFLCRFSPLYPSEWVCVHISFIFTSTSICRIFSGSFVITNI